MDAIILAAGVGKRMRSSLPKVLHPLDDTPMLCYLLKTITRVPAIAAITIVVPREHRLIAETVKRFSGAGNGRVRFAVQREQRGTGDAFRAALAGVKKISEHLFVFCGDMPLLTAVTIEQMITNYTRSRAAAIVLTARFTDPTGYGRIIRDRRGSVRAIVEHRDATPSQLRIDEINSGMYIFRTASVTPLLERLSDRNDQKEYYLTDIVQLLRRRRRPVIAYCTPDAPEIMGINSRQQLADAEQIRNRRRVAALMTAGVSFENPGTCVISDDTGIGPDTYIEANVVIRGRSVIGGNCRIGSGSVLRDVVVHNHTRIHPLTRMC